MTTTLRHGFFFFGLLFASLAMTDAQEPEEKGPMVRFTVWGNWGGQDLYVENPNGPKGEERHIKLDLLDLGYSAEIPYERNKPIDLCVRVENDGETRWQTLIRVTVPPGVQEPLVMIFTEEEGKATYRIYDLHPSKFPFGSYQVVNLTETRLFAKLDETGILLEPGKQGHFKARGPSKLNVWLRVAAEDREKNGRIIYSSMMKNRSDKRMFMFFHSPENASENPFAVRTLVDFAPAQTRP